MALVDLELSWKFLDRFPKDGNMACLGGALKISVSKFSHLGRVAHSLSRTLRNSIADCFDLRSGDRISISAGNVTSVFSLPKALAVIAKRLPNTPFIAKRVESALTIWKDELARNKVDIMLCVLNVRDGVEEGYLSKLVDFSKNRVARRYIDDPGYLACARSVLETYTKEECLHSGNLLFGRLTTGVGLRSTNDDFYFSLPRDRANEEPRIISDYYFMSFIFMKEGAGIWHTFSPSHDKSNCVRLGDEPITVLRRQLIARIGLPRKLNFLVSVIMSGCKRKVVEYEKNTFRAKHSL